MISKVPILKLESRGYDQSQYGLVLPWPRCKSAFGAKQTSTGTNDRLGRSKMNPKATSSAPVSKLDVTCCPRLGDGSGVPNAVAVPSLTT